MVMLLVLLRLLRTTGHIWHVGRGPMVHDLRLTRVVDKQTGFLLGFAMVLRGVVKRITPIRIRQRRGFHPRTC